MVINVKNTKFIIFIVSVLLIILGIETIMFTSFNINSDPEIELTDVRLGSNPQEVIFFYDDESDVSHNESLIFKTEHRSVQMYIEDEKIYDTTQNPSDQKLFKSDGLVWHEIPISLDYVQKNITLKFIPTVSGFDTECTIFQGSSDEILGDILLKDLPNIITFGLMFCLFIMMTITAGVRMRYVANNSHMISIAVFSFVFASWRLADVNFLKIIISNGIFWSNMGMLSLGLLPILFCVYVKEYAAEITRKVCDRFNLIALFFYLLMLVLQVFGIKQIYECSYIIMIILCISIINGAICIIRDWRTRCKLSAHMRGILIVAFCAIFDVIYYYMFRVNPLLTAASVLVYLTWSSILEMQLAKANEFKAVQLETYKRLAFIDELTSVFNKSGLESNVSACLRLDKKYAFMMIDLDCFKDINDNFGHQYGDKVLKEVASIITDNIDKDDIVGRLGGDEFVVLYKYDTNEQVSKKAEQLKMMLFRTYSEHEVSVEISASIGIALAPEDGDNFNQLYLNADTAMYKVKKSEKNGYVFFNEI